MLVLGSRGTGAFGWMALGSVGRYAAAHASCPVLVIRGETAAVHRRVGIGIGDLDACADSLAFAFEEASLRKASLMAIHAVHLPAISRAGAGLGDRGQVARLRAGGQPLAQMRNVFPVRASRRIPPERFVGDQVPELRQVIHRGGRQAVHYSVLVL